MSDPSPASAASLYASDDKPVPVKTMTIAAIVQSIINPPESRCELVAKVRAATNDADRKLAKSGLPFVTWAGVFSYRRDNALLRHSGYTYVDVDAPENAKRVLTDLETAGRQDDAAELKAAMCDLAELGLNQLRLEPWCAGAWRSVSNRGLGILLPTKCWHSARAAVAALFEPMPMPLEVDAKASNLSRANYLSHDPVAHWNPDAIAPPKVEEPPSEPERRPSPVRTNTPLGLRITGTLAAISMDLVGGPYTAGHGTYADAGVMTEAMAAYTERDEGVMYAWLDKLEADGRFADSKARSGFKKTWRTGGGFSRVGAGTFVHIVKENAARRGVDSPLPRGERIASEAAKTLAADIEVGF